MPHSLNPVDAAARLGRVAQTHFVGADDDIVPAKVVRAYLARLPDRAGARGLMVPDFDHDCCWVKDWPALLRQAEWVWIVARADSPKHPNFTWQGKINVLAIILRLAKAPILELSRSGAICNERATTKTPRDIDIMRLDKALAILGVAGALLALPALIPAWATEQQQKPNATNQPAHTVIQRAAAKQQTDRIKDRVRGVQLRAMRDAESKDGTANARAEPRLLSTGDDATR